MDLLVIDEMGYLNLKPEQSNIFFKLMEERYQKKSTIITTNLKYVDWYDFLGRKEMVGAFFGVLLKDGFCEVWVRIWIAEVGHLYRRGWGYFG